MATNQSSNLLPCPFCGRQPYESGGYVSCHTELCLANADYHEPAIGPITDWNTRPIEDALNARIAELEAAQRWIPVSERLPEEFTLVLTFSKDNDKPVTAILAAGFWWSNVDDAGFWSSNVDWTLNVTHWMPLPQPPEVQK